jgi:pimeloyl-ACP methyl ester carboxylesterase
MRVMELIALVHAPSLGPASWLPVARELSRAGCRVVVPDLRGFAEGGPPYVPRLVEVAARQLRAAGRDDELIMVAHSGAGVLAPYLIAAAGAGRAAAVFAEAALPRRPGASTVVEAGFLPYLRQLADHHGIVPPWPQWWPHEDLSPLFPDEAARKSVTGEAQPLPQAFFEELLPALPGGWPPCVAGYLVFSEPYRREAGEAAQAGWPVREVPGGHLHMLVDPGAVAAKILRLAAAARASGSSLSALP